MDDRVIHRLIYYMALQDNGCPLERHELLDREWHMLGIVKSERDAIMMEEAKKRPSLSMGG